MSIIFLLSKVKINRQLSTFYVFVCVNVHNFWRRSRNTSVTTEKKDEENTSPNIRQEDLRHVLLSCPTRKQGNFFLSCCCCCRIPSILHQRIHSLYSKKNHKKLVVMTTCKTKQSHYHEEERKSKKKGKVKLLVSLVFLSSFIFSPFILSSFSPFLSTWHHTSFQDKARQE